MHLALDSHVGRWRFVAFSTEMSASDSMCFSSTIEQVLLRLNVGDKEDNECMSESIE